MALVRRDTSLDGKKECAVSEIIGSIMLVSIVVVAVAIVGVVLWSQPAPEKIPVLSAGIANQSCKVTVSHTGGDTLENTTFSIFVDGNDRTANFNKGGTPGSWTSWGIGETLVYDPTPCTPSQVPKTVQIIYTGGNGALILSQASFVGSGSVVSTITPTPPHTITASAVKNSGGAAGGWGSISPSGAVTVADGASQTFTITAGSKNILSVVVDGVSQPVTNPTTTYTFINVIADHTIVATFG